jgi:hypothetical protein
MSKRAQSFVKFLSQKDIDYINSSNMKYVNIFRQLNSENKWTFAGYDAFEDASECEFWAKEYIKYPENSPSEICSMLDIVSVNQAWENSSIN